MADGSPAVLGYHALNAHSMAAEELGADRSRRAPRTGTIPALYLSTIAVDGLRQGTGLGSDPAVVALGRALSVAGKVGLKLVVLDVIDDGGAEVFARRMKSCRRLGFRNCQHRPEPMFITIDTIRAMVDNG